MKLIGSSADFNGPQIFLLTDPVQAKGWMGVTNGEQKTPEGSHWGKLEALASAHDPPLAARATIDEVMVDYVFTAGIGGWHLVYQVDDRLVLAEVVPDEDEVEVTSSAGETESVPSGQGFEAYITAPPGEDAVHCHDLVLPSKWALLMSSGEALGELENGPTPQILSKSTKEVFQVDDENGGHALFWRVKHERYGIWMEKEGQFQGGSGWRVILVPVGDD